MRPLFVVHLVPEGKVYPALWHHGCPWKLCCDSAALVGPIAVRISVYKAVNGTELAVGGISIVLKQMCNKYIQCIASQQICSLDEPVLP